MGADGSLGRVRRFVAPDCPLRLAYALEVLVKPSNPSTCLKLGFEFSSIGRGLPGYVWRFPSVRPHRDCVSLGVFSRSAQRHGDHCLAGFLRDCVLNESSDHVGLTKSHPIGMFAPRQLVHRNRVLFVGDAAGSDPLLGEGISFAIQYGKVAASALVRCFGSRFDLETYRADLFSSPVGTKLRFAHHAANLFYSSYMKHCMPFAFARFWRFALRNEDGAVVNN